ncbi:MAG: surface-adhesin E family protein [Phenylobacterium sp.]
MRIRIGLVAAGVFALAHAAAAQPSAKPPPAEQHDEASLKAWAADNLDPDGWVYYGFTTPQKLVVLWYVAEKSIPGSKFPIVSEWIRSESALSPGSRLARIEVDCERRRLRNMEEVLYAGNNLRGPITAANDTSGSAWSPITNGSVGDTLVQRVCRDAR